ncbi:helix-turn-helix domain-containing protein [Flavobacterium sp. SORGH_AS_0622]|uniref:helix-turn-helix domain-containing protein n=1 Tax=Flavobacterium sp. SORGH_AS_0622 TaxID=3041772 RepID=UPI0027805AAB|nr:helix-turn-helix domain-containing protein [Flavobacterium sp. SORGH_AS_0622]MDQ1164664.1 AraC family transcriptional activator of pobA [Flavobacterium sp. SORGH_AS_0622]
MIRDLINLDLDKLPISGLAIHFIKKYEVMTNISEAFIVPNFSLLLLKSGKFNIQLEDITQEMKERDLLVIPRNSYCSLIEVHGKVQLYLISFSTDYAIRNGMKKELIESFYFVIGLKAVKIGLEEKEFLVLSLIFKLIYFVNKDAQNGSQDLDLQKIGFTLLLYELRLIYNKYTPEHIQQITQKENLIMRFFTILSIHYKKQHDAKFYAGALYVTPGHLNKVVKQITGKSIKRLIVQTIITEAEILLDDLTITIAEIADELEFPSANSFSVFFKKHSSISPSQYRLNAAEKFKTH